MKWLAFALFACGGAGLIALGVLAISSPAQARYAPVPALVLRPLPQLPARREVPIADAKPTDAKPTDAKPTDAKPTDAKPTDAKPTDAKPADAKPAEARPAPRPSPGAARAFESILNLRASDTAEVYLDGKKLSPGSPVLGLKVKAGSHKVRFDCFDAAGNAIAGVAQLVEVGAGVERDVDFECPAP